MSETTKFVAGFARFRQKYFGGDNDLYEQLKVAQRPRALVIACSDSRVDPAILFDAEPGELFVVRNVANLVPPHAGDQGTHGVSAALEFAVCSLEVSDIIILGHSKCGGIQALLHGAAGEYVTKWMNIARDAAVDAERSSKDPSLSARACEQRAILLSLRNLTTFPWLKERIDRGQLETHGWYFDLDGGNLEINIPGSPEFRSWRSLERA